MATKNSFTVGNCSTLKTDQLTIPDVNISDKDVQIWPTPAKDKLFIKLNPADTRQIQVISITGGGVRSYEVKGEPFVQIDVSDYKQGVYFVRFIGKSNTIRKVVKE